MGFILLYVSTKVLNAERKGRTLFLNLTVRKPWTDNFLFTVHHLICDFSVCKDGGRQKLKTKLKGEAFICEATDICSASGMADKKYPQCLIIHNLDWKLL